MKHFVAVAFLALPIACHAGAGMPCKTVEYSQLKDSSKIELQDMYCRAKRYDAFNADAAREVQGQAEGMLGKQDVSLLLRQADEYIAARQTCIASADAAWGMLTKKYKIKQPSCK